MAKGDLAIRAKKLELKLGSEKSDYEMSQKIFEMETGKAYNPAAAHRRCLSLQSQP